MEINNKDPGQGRDYQMAALLLANSYESLLKEKEYIEKVLSGEFVYTEDDALEELVHITASTESETGIRVQTCNTSNTTERIGLLLADGFVEKRNREILQEVLNDTEGRQYLAWRIGIIETAKRERMSKFERGIFDRLFVRHKSYKEIRDAYKAKRLYDRDINDARKSIITAIADEVELRDDGADEYDESRYIERLYAEAEISSGINDSGTIQQGRI